MLIIDRTQRDWAVVSLVVTAVGGAVYVVYSRTSLNGPSGGSVPGLVFGILAAGMMVFAGLLAARRRLPAARMGNAQFWLRGHLWIGTLTIPFALFHAGFGVGGPVEWVLWILFFAIVLSGFWGLFLQQLLPRMMLEQLPRETFVEQIPHLCAKYSAESDRLLAEMCGPLELPLSQSELNQVRPYLAPYFEEDRKKNRNDYPKTMSDAQLLDIYLAKIYAAVKSPIAKPAAEVKPLMETAPAMPPVARTAPREDLEPATTPAVIAAATVENSALVQPAETSPVTVVTSLKPDPKALLAAAKAKKAVDQQPAATTSITGPAAAEVAQAAVVNPPASKPDPKAMLAAAQARKAEAASPKSEPTPPGKPADAAEAVAEAGSASPPSSAKPDPRALLAAARAKKEAAAAIANPVANADTPVDGPSVTGKPDPKAMLAAMKARKEATARESPAAVAIQPAVVAAKPVSVKEPPVERPSTPPPAAKANPPSPTQIAELKQMYLELIRPQLPLQPATRAWVDAIRRSALACHVRQEVLHPLLVPIFDRLRDVCEQRKQFAFVIRYQRWLHGWLLIHIPATVALYVILLVHAVSALRVTPFGN